MLDILDILDMGLGWMGVSLPRCEPFEQTSDSHAATEGGNSHLIPTPNPRRSSLAGALNGLPRVLLGSYPGSNDIARDYVMKSFPERKTESRIEEQAAAASVLRGPE
ncbi:hypothetical protein INS49_015288 [Diaporthe citri]|uniref:uncharacterized protein n=1 Tax=Diaporthe citri TaxID=83186 RepID=UPI001C7E8759|nr:uncharacterized protein INS49_015288 [Diaporthe citri]KAG6355904.1 hypothetical protein INS49_015288 [Diaporthe citri]